MVKIAKQHVRKSRQVFVLCRFEELLYFAQAIVKFKRIDRQQLPLKVHIGMYQPGRYVSLNLEDNAEDILPKSGSSRPLVNLHLMKPGSSTNCVQN